MWKNGRFGTGKIPAVFNPSRRSLARLSPEPCAEWLNGSTMRKRHKRFFSDAFKKEILVAKPRLI